MVGSQAVLVVVVKEGEDGLPVGLVPNLLSVLVVVPGQLSHYMVGTPDCNRFVPTAAGMNFPFSRRHGNE